jgi:hypothetical protein
MIKNILLVILLIISNCLVKSESHLRRWGVRVRVGYGGYHRYGYGYGWWNPLRYLYRPTVVVAHPPVITTPVVSTYPVASYPVYHKSYYH